MRVGLRLSLAALAALLGSAPGCCRYVEEGGPIIPPPKGGALVLTTVTPDPPLPEGRQALLQAADEGASEGPAGPQLERSLAAVQALLALNESDGEAAWRGVRTLCFKLMARQGEEAQLTSACMRLSSRAMAYSEGVEAPYWTALCLGMRAKANHREGLDLIPKMIKAARLALERDPAYEHAGPHRLLGGIYLRAPEWPTSVGDIELALEFLTKAVQAAPEWPENHILLAEALIDDDSVERAREHMDEAQKRLADHPAWRATWTKQLEELEDRIEQGSMEWRE